MVNFDALVIGPLQGVFGEMVIFHPVIGSQLPVTGVFDKGYTKEVLFEDGSVGVTTFSPTLGIQLSQFTVQPVQNDRFYVPSVNTTYVVREPRLDGHGGMRLMLNKVSSP